MARPREFDETAVLDMVIECFWERGFEATSIRDLAARTGLTGPSLYNAFGDKGEIYRRAFERYVGRSVRDRIRRLERLPPQEAIEAFFEEVISRSLDDPQRKGCLLVNSAMELAPHNAACSHDVVAELEQIESFFRRSIQNGQRDGTISTKMPADDLARHMLGLLMGLLVLSRVRPEGALLNGLMRPAFQMLEGE